MNDHDLAEWLAVEAGIALMDVRAEHGTGDHTKAIGDRVANEWILEALARERPDDHVLSEESVDDLSRLGGERVWIIDPLDGTREFSEGSDDFAVHIALVSDGSPIAAAVAMPARGEVFSSRVPYEGAHDPVHAPLRMVVSRTRPPAFATMLAEELGAVLVPLGSAGVKAMAVVSRSADVYAHHGGMYEWDSCAPSGVAVAAGVHVSRLDGTPLLYNRHDPYLPDLLICHPAVAASVIAAAQRCLAEAATAVLDDDITMVGAE